MDLLELLSLLGFTHHLMGDDRKVKYNYISNRVDKVSMPNRHYCSLNGSRGGLLSLAQGSRGDFIMVFVYSISCREAIIDG